MAYDTLIVAREESYAVDRALEMETRAFLESLKTEDAAEGIQAFFAKREPEFKGR